MNHKHEEGYECEACKNGIEALREKEQALLKNPGWFVHFVFDDEKYPFNTNFHTHGLLENFNHTDLQICLPAPPETSHNIMTNIVEMIKEGKTFEAGKKYPDILGNDLLISFLESEEGGRPILRLICPEKDGTFRGQLVNKQIVGCKNPELL